MDVSLPERQYPVVHLQRRWHRDDERGRGKEETKVRIHAAHVHMVSPHHKTQCADNHDCPDHHPVAKNIFSGVDADEVRDYAKGWQRNDVDLGVPEEPEEVLEQQRIAADVIRLVTHRHNGRHEKAGAQKDVQRHHDGTHKQRGEGKQRQHGGHKNTPYGERHSHQRHAPRSGLQDRHHVVQAPHGESDDKDR